MKVYVIRHGESETNFLGKWTGWCDARLTKKGRADAMEAAKLLKNVSFDKVYASDLVRATETAEVAIQNCHYETSTLLREINVGSLENKPLSIPNDEDRAKISKYGYTDFGGESKEDFYSRIDKFKTMLESSEYSTVAVFSHAGWLRGMLDTVVGAYLPRKSVCCNNCTVAIFEYTDGIWRLHSWINVL